MLTVMASFTGRRDMHASEGTEQPDPYTANSSVTVGADADPSKVLLLSNRGRV